MEFQEALQKAREYYAANGKNGIASALEAEEVWIFYGGTPGVVEVGGAGITIHKQTGEIADLILPSDEGFAILRKAVKVEL